MLGLVTDQRPADGVLGIQAVGLGQGADSQTAALGDPAGVRLQLAGEQTQQAGLPIAVAADDADARAVVDAEGDRIEDDLGRIRQVNGLGSEQVCHWTEGTGRLVRYRCGQRDATMHRLGNDDAGSRCETGAVPPL